MTDKEIPDNDQVERRVRAQLDEDIAVHIFSISATLVGVCLTVIGILHVVFHDVQTDSYGDDLLTADAMLFLISCLLSYFALRTRGTKRRHTMERIADGVFITALVVMAFACGVITYALF
jgi:hypothetical protein